MQEPTTPAPSALRPDLSLLLAFWKTALGLSDWVIVAEYDRTLAPLGKTRVWWSDREARVLICEPSQITREWPPIDVELTFVHELVHCVVDPLYESAVNEKLPENMREQVVEQIAKTLVRMHRVYPLKDDWLRAR